MLSRLNRLAKNKDFERVWQKGRSFFIKEIGIKFLGNNFKYSRFGIIVSNKVMKKAVLRNKIKRRIREIIRLRISFIKMGVDCVILAREGIGGLSYKELEERVEFILRKVNLLKSGIIISK